MFRRDTASFEGGTWSVGIGGGCSAYHPPAGFMCSNVTGRWGPTDHAPRWPSGLSVDRSILPHAPWYDPGAVAAGAYTRPLLSST